MTIIDYIFIFITSIGGTTSVLLILAFLSKSLLSNIFIRELEKIKSQLSIQAHETNTKISRLDRDKAEAVKKIHFSLAKLEYQAVLIFLPFTNISARLDVILQAQCDMGNKFISFQESVVNFQYELELYSIYLESLLIEEINETVKKLKQNTHDTILEISNYIETKIRPIEETERNLEFLFNAKKCFEDNFNQTFYPLRRKLIDTFRILLSY